nr:NUDIX domain-containing protein [Halorubrum ezzemoulense]
MESDERPREAVCREIVEESGIQVDELPQRLTTDLWQRRASPPRYCLRHFYHVSLTESRDCWTHTVTGAGSERELEYEFSWVDLPPTEEFALALDHYVRQLDVESVRA